jgi:hypothetical protein
MRLINAKFKSVCNETGCTIKKGERCVYDPITKKCYAIGSNKAVAFINNKETTNEDERDTNGMRSMIQANEDAYFDNFCYRENI